MKLASTTPIRILTASSPPKFVVEAVIIDSEPQVPIMMGMTLAGLKRFARLRVAG
jgi:hypothetical protein